MDRYINIYMQHLSRINTSPNTVRAYRRDLEQFVAFIKENQLAAGFLEIDTMALRIYLAHLHQKRLQKSSIARKMACLRSFFKFLCRQGVISDNVTRYLHNPKQEKKLPLCLTIEEVFTLLDRAIDAAFPAPPGEPAHHSRRRPQYKLRDKAMLEMLYGCGMRAAELVGLDLDSVSLKEGLVRILGKGEKERLVPVGAKARQALEAYLAKRPTFNPAPEESAIFLNRRGGRLSTRSLGRILDKYIRLAALDKKVSPHTLRHSFATHLLNNGAGIRDIQELLGHANISSTQRYTHLDTAKLMEVYDKTHPRA